MLPTRPSFAIQILINLVPLFGVMLLGWNTFALFYAYWLETFAIAFFNTIKILSARQAGLGYRIYKSCKFLIIQSFLLLFYLVFIIVFIGFQVKLSGEEFNFVKYFAFIDPSFRIAMILLFVTKFIELIVTYFIPKQYASASPDQFYYFFSARIILIHVVIVLGVFTFNYFQKQFGDYYGVLMFTAIFVFMKIVLDAFSFEKVKKSQTDTQIPYI